MLSNADIERYKDLQKQTQEANNEKRTMQAEIKVYSERGMELLAKYGYESYKDLPKLKERIEKMEKEIVSETQQMEDFCRHMADKKLEKMTIFNKD